MSVLVPVLLALPCAYLLGSLLGARLAQNLFGLPDPLRFGSGNPGASNLYRLGGFWPAALTLAWDVGKGILAIQCARLLQLPDAWLAAVALAVVLGHIFPLFNRFHGGKGVASAMGATLAIAPQTTLLLIALWWGLVAWRRTPSLASLSVAVAAPGLAWWLEPQQLWLFGILSLIILLRHRDNILRLARGEEQEL